MPRPGGSQKSKDPLTFFPLTFNQSRIRTYVTPTASYERYRRTGRVISRNPDPKLLGEVLLLALKSGACMVPTDPTTLELARIRAFKEGV